MTISNTLFRLIRSLSQSEKRYFKLYVTVQHQKTKYMQLFEAIDEQDMYNEQALRLQFSAERFLKNFSEAKKYLFNLILKSMRAYRSDINIENKIFNLLKDVAFLYEKGLYAQCYKMINKAKKVAYTYEKYIQLLDIYKWERNLLSTEFKFKQLKDGTSEQ